MSFGDKSYYRVSGQRVAAAGEAHQHAAFALDDHAVGAGLRLLALGLTQKQAVAVLYAASGILGAAAVLLAANAAIRFWLLLGAVTLAFGIWLYIFAGHRFPADPAAKKPDGEDKEDGSTKP